MVDQILTTVSAYAHDLADRMALRDLVYSYARYIDNRSPELLGSLVCEGGELVVPTPAVVERPALVFVGPEGWAGAFTLLAHCTATNHFVGNHLVSIRGDIATGETYCLAHELYDSDGGGRITVRCIRYTDNYVRVAEQWLFRRRELIVDWVDDRASTRPPDRRTGASDE